jgi:hypothetical protein
MRKLLLVAIGLVFGIGLLAGCGSSDKKADDKAETTTTVADNTTVKGSTKAAFIAQADALCKTAQAKINALPIDPNASASVVGAALLEQGVPIQRQLMKDVRALTPPTGDEAEVTAIFDKASDAIENLAQDLAADPAAALSGDDPFAEANAAAAEYGFVECSK